MISDQDYPIYLFNTLKKDKEKFISIKNNHVGMYHCGPTVYNYAHIGNLRAFIATDILRRVFEYNNYSVTQIMNITDIGHLQSDADDGEDKMTLALKREGLPLNLESMKIIANKYYDAFRNDLEEINIKPANLFPFASEHIKEDIDFINDLLAKNHAYKTADGIYFDTNSLERYGRLGGISNIEETESRLGDIAVAESGKKNFRDFAIWKFNDSLGYDAPFGKGFPGWHIECSVMSMKYLGDTFDIHTGGTDHISVHHNNEIAQSEAHSGKILANYWLHNEHIIIDGGKKMAKSGDKFYTLSTLIENGISPLGFRFWVLGASYRSQIQFSIEALHQAENAYQNLIGRVADIIVAEKNNSKSYDTNISSDIHNINNPINTDGDQNQTHFETWNRKFIEIINNDLDTAGAIALLNNLIKDSAISNEIKIKLIESYDAVLGLELISLGGEKAELALSAGMAPIPDHIKELAEKRLIAREQKNWAESDSLRDEIKMQGYEIKDEGNSYTLNKIL